MRHCAGDRPERIDLGRRLVAGAGTPSCTATEIAGAIVGGDLSRPDMRSDALLLDEWPDASKIRGLRH